MIYYFYILRCSDKSLYCGQTNNLQRRISEHNFDRNKSAKYLRAKKPVKLIYSEEYPTLQSAMKREWQIKRWNRSKKEALVKRDLKLYIFPGKLFKGGIDHAGPIETSLMMAINKSLVHMERVAEPMGPIIWKNIQSASEKEGLERIEKIVNQIVSTIQNE